MLGDDDESDASSVVTYSPERPSSPEIIDLTNDDEDCVRKMEEAVQINSDALRTSSELNSSPQAMSISPVVSEQGDDNTEAVVTSPARSSGNTNSSSRRRGSKNSNAEATAATNSGNAPATDNGLAAKAGDASGTPTPSRTNATRASKPLYKPPVNRYSTWSKKEQMTRADLDMNWRASARGPGSDQSSNSGGEMPAPLPPTPAGTSRKSGEKVVKDNGWREGTKPPHGSQKSRKSQEG